MRLIERANGFMNSPDKYFEWEKMKLVHDLKSKVEEMQKTITEIGEQIPTMQDESESPTLRHNAGNMILFKIEQALKGVAHE